MAQRHRKRGLLRGAVLTAVAAVALTACGPAQQAEQQTQPSRSDADPGLGHVHGLGVDPADGTLYAASHYGMFRLPEDGQPTRVADRRQDTMGFTIVGPRHFLGSGHPDPAENLPDHLGLIESTDAGKTWRSVSLAGKADFHALEAKHDRVYGYDSVTQQIMVTEDRQRWEPRAQLALADFAVDPRSADVLLATTAEGPMRSTDGGRTFTAVPSAPLLLLVDWRTEKDLVGVDPNGTVHTSHDGGRSWSPAGQVAGTPQALAADGASDVYIATETGIHESDDGGHTFTQRMSLR